MILVQVVGLPSSSVHAESVAGAKAIALDLAKKHPQHWVHARYPDGVLVHLIEPRSLVLDGEPETTEPVDVIDGQEGLFA